MHNMRNKYSSSDTEYYYNIQYLVCKIYILPQLELLALMNTTIKLMLYFTSFTNNIYTYTYYFFNEHFTFFLSLSSNFLPS